MLRIQQITDGIKVRKIRLLAESESDAQFAVRSTDNLLGDGDVKQAMGTSIEINRRDDGVKDFQMW